MKRSTIMWLGVLALILLCLFVPQLRNGLLTGLKHISGLQSLIANLQVDNAQLRKDIEDVVVVRDSINHALQQAHTLTTARQSALDSALQEIAQLAGYEAQMQAVIDSLSGELASVSAGGGTVVVHDSGRLVDGKYEDDWIDISVYGRDTLTTDTSSFVYDSIGYSFEFGIGDVRVTKVDDEGISKTVYSVWIESLRNPGKRRYLDNYSVTETIGTPVVRPWQWWDPRITAGWQFVEALQAELGIGLSAVTPAPWRYEGGNLLRFPILSIMSNFQNEHAAGVGILANLGYIVPLIKDLHLKGGYAWGASDSRSGVTLSIGTTL